METKKLDVPDRIILKPLRTGDLAKLYGISRVTMRKWLKLMEAELGEKTGYYYKPIQVEIIIKKLFIKYKL